jgi:hypothetical protein
MTEAVKTDKMGALAVRAGERADGFGRVDRGLIAGN